MTLTSQKLGKLGVAILEGFVGKHLGENFINELRADFHSHKNLLTAMLESEKIFRKNCKDPLFCRTIFDDLPIMDLAPIQYAAARYYSNPSDHSTLVEPLKTILIRDLRQFAPSDIEDHISSYVSVLTKQLVVLDDRFSQKINTLTNLEIAEASKENLQAMKDLAQGIRQLSAKEELMLAERFEQTSRQEECPTFSDSIREQFALVNKTIQDLTTDQFKVIESLRGKKRVAISGCAGSGKTLVAAEKAVRLSKGGLNVLILCHSPNLAEYIDKLCKNSGVLVRDFTAWIKKMITKNAGPNVPLKWTHFEEPTEDELGIALPLVSDAKEKYDVIIVDEGQDFRDTWWAVIEAALISPTHGILYIFYDDNQALLPSRSVYPVETAPFSLSKNCRNAGEVFRLVSRFHNQSPEGSSSLSNKGIVKYSYYLDSGVEETVVALGEALRIMEPHQLVILTTEACPAPQSILNGRKYEPAPSWNWQKAVRNELFKLRDSIIRLNLEPDIRRLRLRMVERELSQFSQSPEPLDEDILTVMSFAGGLAEELPQDPTFVPNRTISWKEISGDLFLDIGASQEYAYLPLDPIRQKLHFFSSESWVYTLPSLPTSCKIVSNEGAVQYANHIPLYTVPSFKGLESDGIILYVNRSASEIVQTPIPDLYVGSSRARFLLHIVAPRNILKYVPHFRR